MILPATPEPRVIGPITRTDIVRYQGASGDMNPIHHDELFARAAGMPAPVSVGMLQAGYLATYATDWLGAENIRSFKIRFRAPVWPGDVLTLTGRVLDPAAPDPTASVDADPTGSGSVVGEPRVQVELECVKQDSTVVITVLASFAVA